MSRPVQSLPVLLVLIAGCSAVPPDSRMGDVEGSAPGSWAASREARAGVDSQWINRFGDRDLQRMVREGYARNYDLKLAEERVSEAASNARLAAVPGRPQATAGVDGSYRRQQFLGFPGGGGDTTFESYSSAVDVTWELDIWGRIRSAEAAELAQFEARGYEVRAARASLAAQIARSWFALGEANEQIALGKTALGIRQKTEQAILDRFELALEQEGGTASQVRLARTETEAARENIARWEGERARALRDVELLVGRYPVGSDLSRQGLPKIPSSPPAGLPSELLLRRPDILIAERNYAGAGKRVDEARLAMFPSLSLTGGIGSSTDDISKLLDSEFGSWNMGAGVTQALLTGGRLRYEKFARESRERQTLIELQKTVLDAFGEVEQALVADRYLARRVAAQSAAAKEAREAAKSAADEFAEGTTDVLTLLASENQAIGTAQGLITLRRAQLDNRVALHLALGGDYKVSKK